MPEHLHYGDPRGSGELRAAIADHLLSARGLRCDPEQIMLTTGTQHGLQIVLSAILKAGRSGVVRGSGLSRRPATPSRIAAAGRSRCRSISPASSLRGAVRRRRTHARRYVTPSHQFPLGMQMSMPRRLELLDWAQGANAWMLEDDYDSEFRYDGAPLLSLAGIDHLRRVIYMGTFAKTLFPGLRIGYCALPEGLIAPVTKARAAIDRFPVDADGRRHRRHAELRRVLGQRSQSARHLSRGARCAGANVVGSLGRPAATSRSPRKGCISLRDLALPIDAAVAARAKARAGVDGWLLADTCFRIRPMAGYVLGFAGHPRDHLVDAADKLAKASLAALRKR